MKVSELMSMLTEIDSDAVVIVATDGEGNGYSPLAGADPDCVYLADSTWSGEVMDKGEYYEEYLDEYVDTAGHQTNCIVLFPVG